MAVPNIFASATSAIPLSQLDTNFATAITLGNTAVYLGNTTTSLGNVTLTNVTISSGNVSVSTATVGAGSNTAPSITTTGDTNTGIFFPAADTIAFTEGGVEAARFDSAGNFGLGVTPYAWFLGSSAKVFQNNNGSFYADSANSVSLASNWGFTSAGAQQYISNGFATRYIQSSGQHIWNTAPSGTAGDAITFTQAMTLDASGNLLVAKTAVNATDGGFVLSAGNGTDQSLIVTNTRADNGGEPIVVNRQGSDGTLIDFKHANTLEGSVSVSGTTVSYNGGHLSRWAQMLTKPDLLKGTVMSNLDEMNVYIDADGNPVDNEQLNKVKVSDVEGDANVAGVFVNWSYDEAHSVDEINMAMTGDMIIRIAQGVTVARGDLLMSAGDGTAKPQGDDIVRSKTIAKVTSTHVTCTYADGSYCVPCVLMAC